MTWSRQRTYAVFIILGVCILLYRTVMMLSQGTMEVLVLWVFALLIADFLLDVTTLLSSIRWWVTGAERHAVFPLRVFAAAIVLHAIRVLIFVLGRTGPWIDFDVRPEERFMHAERWNWDQVYFAAVMSALGVIGVIVVWIYRRRNHRNRK